jgi:hypothetical protein
VIPWCYTVGLIGVGAVCGPIAALGGRPLDPENPESPSIENAKSVKERKGTKNVRKKDSYLWRCVAGTKGDKRTCALLVLSDYDRLSAEAVAAQERRRQIGQDGGRQFLIFLSNKILAWKWTFVYSKNDFFCVYAKNDFFCVYAKNDFLLLSCDNVLVARPNMSYNNCYCHTTEK